MVEVEIFSRGVITRKISREEAEELLKSKKYERRDDESIRYIGVD